MSEVRFKDLSTPLKVIIVMSTVVICIYLISFFIGVWIGLNS